MDTQAIRHFYEAGHTSIKYALGDVDIYGNVFHEWYELYLLMQGDVEYINSRARRSICPGQLVIIPPGEYHQFLVLDNIQRYERCVIDIKPEFLPQDIPNSVLHTGGVLTLPAGHRILSDYRYLTECLTRTPNTDLFYILPALATDIIFLLKNTAATETLSSGNLRPASLRLIEYIDAHYTEPLSLEEIARECFLSVSSICHLFREDFGISIKKYILQKRMNGARLALLAGGSCNEVSISFGFSTYSEFYRAYRQYYGCAPSETDKQPANGSRRAVKRGKSDD